MLTVTFQQFHLKTTRINDEAEKNSFWETEKLQTHAKMSP